MTLPTDPRMQVSSYPLIVFVHVPKTAGSTLKTFLTRCTPRGDGDVNRIAKSRTDLLDVARRSDWISGHLSRDTLADSLSWLDRPIEYYSVVRKPVDQLVSYLNFSIHRRTANVCHDSYDAYDKSIDAEVAKTDFSNPSSIIEFLSRNSERYLNVQSRLIVGEDFASLEDQEIQHRLATYTYIANETNLVNIYHSFGFAQIPEGSQAIRENVAVRYIKPDIFNSPQLQKFLGHHHQHDMRLYATLMDASWPAERRRSFRPSLLGEEVFTHENFAEQAYLHSNPDVAAVVGYGGLESGFAHFNAFGHREARMKRRWVFAATEQGLTSRKLFRSIFRKPATRLE